MHNQPTTHHAVTCPACGLLCDDLVVHNHADKKLSVANTTCLKSIGFFNQNKVSPTPLIKGKPSSLEEAIQEVAKHLQVCSVPLYAALGTDIQGMRALLPLIEETQGVVDHMNSPSQFKNILAMQRTGWQVTTLTEARNRADTFLIIGANINKHNPRFFEKIVNPRNALFNDPKTRKVIYLGEQTFSLTDTPINQSIFCKNEALPEILTTLNALLLGKKTHVKSVQGVSIESLENLAETLKASQYAVITWISADLNYDAVDITVTSILELINQLNQSTRAMGLPLGGSYGDYSVQQVSTWTTGYPGRLKFDQKRIKYDPFQYETNMMIAHNQTDLILWISTLDANQHPPQTEIPTIILGHPELAKEVTAQADVFIPVAVPGIHQAGFMVRIDSSVTLPLKALIHSDLPHLAQVIGLIESLFIQGKQP
jgi:formylmethanofuran dehydrogenase subunit B